MFYIFNEDFNNHELSEELYILTIKFNDKIFCYYNHL